MKGGNANRRSLLRYVNGGIALGVGHFYAAPLNTKSIALLQ